MKKAAVFPSNYLAAVDFDEPKDLEIQMVVSEAQALEATRFAPEDRAIVTFVGMNRGLILNETNWDTLEELYGEESDDWSGNWVTLYATTPKSKGKTVACLRIKEEAPRRFDPPPIETARGEVHPNI